MERLCDVLEVRRGVTAVIGGGGKTSLLYRLASELRERGMVLVATTTRILPPAHLPVRHDREGTLRALRANGIACAGTPAEDFKLYGFSGIFLHPGGLPAVCIQRQRTGQARSGDHSGNEKHHRGSAVDAKLWTGSSGKKTCRGRDSGVWHLRWLSDHGKYHYR